jgi:hypothetical protein
MAMSDDELLSPRTATANEPLRTALLDRTTRRLQFVRRLRYAASGGVCVICFLAGMATTLLRPASAPEVVYVQVRDEVQPKEEVPQTAPKRSDSAAELELEAEKTLVKSDSARRFREAGDRYLRDFADYQSALRCYRNFLDEADRADLVVVPEDTWLLTSLKRAREQENLP